MTFPNYDVAESVKVYLWSWDEPNAFIINHSFIGGTDVLATSSLEPTLVSCEVSQITIDTGWELDTAVTFQSMSGQMNLTLRADNGDSFSNPNIILGRKVSVEIPTLLNNFVLFAGYITSFNFEYLPDNQVLINITCQDALYYMFQHISEGDPFPLEPATDLEGQITKILWDYTPPSGAEDFHQLPIIVGTPWAQFIAESSTYDVFRGETGQLINLRLKGEQGAMLAQGNGSEFAIDFTSLLVYTREQILKTLQPSTPGDGIQTINIDTSGVSGVCPSLISFNSDLSRITNQVQVSLDHDSEEFYDLTDRASQIRFGTSSVSASIPFESPDYLPEWARYAMVSNLSPVIDVIQIPAVNRLGSLVSSPNVPFAMRPGGRANTKIQYNGANIEKNYLIRKVRHTIDADNWLIEASLWSRDLSGV
jgi:hypothetical protein